MLILNGLAVVKISECKPLLNIDSYPVAISLDAIKDKVASGDAIDDINGSVDVSVDISSVIERKKTVVNNNTVALTAGKLYRLVVRAANGTVLSSIILTKVQCIVEVSIASLCMGDTVEVVYGK
jgi:hypothetical protein